jgi:glycosyltransferase involved in cell wall biosynthesis
MPRVSVVIPIFNSERYLPEAIASIRSQRFDDFELILLDDGSADGSVEIARHAAKEDARVICVEGDHRGVVCQRNAGVELAKAEFIAMMDADDIALADRLACQVRHLEDHAECCAVGTAVMRIDEDGMPIDEWHLPEHHEEIDDRHMAGRSGAIINPSVMMRKSAVIKAGGYRPGYDSSEDYDLFLRLAEAGRLANLPQVLLRYRLHAKSLTFARAVFQRQMAREALKEAWLRRKRPGSLPAPLLELRAPSEEELMWEWALSAFAARNFGTARNQARKLLRSHPGELRRWALLGAACLGPLAYQLKRILPYRLGAYRAGSGML